MYTPASKRLTGDPVVDDPNFDLKHWTLNAVSLKPYWPLGTEMGDDTARLLIRQRGKWVKGRSIAALCYRNPEDASVNDSTWMIRDCRKFFGLFVEEKIFPEGIRYRWNGEYLKTIDNRQMTDETRREEKKLLQLRVELIAKKAEWFPIFDQLREKRRNWEKRKKNYHKRMKKYRAKIRRMNPNETPLYESCGVDYWPPRLCLIY